ncbi:VWA-like domain-containing protein [Lactobacillaceae bacterium Scapto_B20]
MNIDLQLQRIANNKNEKIDIDSTVDRILGATIIQILKKTRFYGEVLLQLPRRYDEHFKGELGIGWDGKDVVLLVNPKRLTDAKLTADQLFGMLKQVALHLVFKHPLMYPRATKLEQMASDMVVDQYIGDHHHRQLDAINYQYGLNLADEQGSHYYLKHLKQVVQSGQPKPAPSDQRLSKKDVIYHDSHSGWQSFGNQDRTLQTGKLKQLLNRSWHQTPDKQRGVLPGNVVSALPNHQKAPQLNNWQHWLRLGIGTTPLGTITSRARFNRRQAQRMELPGAISNHARKVNLFVDNSGSMGDREIIDLLNEVTHFLNQYPLQVSIYSFDAQVQLRQHYQTNQAAQIRYQRIGGGGTSYQAIFDFMADYRNLLNDTLTIIMTDGKGEKQINPHRFNDVLWILTVPVNKFSLINTDFPGHVTTIVK